jgi:hypothetical protein
MSKEKCNHCNILKNLLDEKEKSNTALQQENASGSKILGIHFCVLKNLKIIVHRSTTQGIARVKILGMKKPKRQCTVCCYGIGRRCMNICI